MALRVRKHTESLQCSNMEVAHIGIEVTTDGQTHIDLI